jgi:hypothetical protein
MQGYSKVILFICSNTTQKILFILSKLTYMLRFHTVSLIVLGNTVVIKLHYNFSIRYMYYRNINTEVNHVKKNIL